MTKHEVELPNPEELEEAKTSAGARAQLKEALRLYFRKVLGR